MTKVEDTALLARLRASLAGIVGKTPSGVGDWSFDKTHDFKKATLCALRVLERGNRASVEALHNAESRLRTYYE